MKTPDLQVAANSSPASGRPYAPFRKVLVPVVAECDLTATLAAARLIAGAGRILFVGLVAVAPGESLSAGAQQARKVRDALAQLMAQYGERARARARVRVSHTPWAELARVAQDERPDLLLLGWPCHFESLRVTPGEVLAHPPCDLALVRGPIPIAPTRVLVAVRGGPFAELGLRVSLAATQEAQADVTALHISPADSGSRRDAAFRGLERVLRGLPEVTRRDAATGDPAEAILTEAAHFSLVVMGATARASTGGTTLGAVADRVMRDCPTGVIAVKTRRPMPPGDSPDEQAGLAAISILVDKWFAENTFEADEFADLEQLLALKERQGLTISLALPALDEEETVGPILETIRRSLTAEVPLLDEVVLIDSNSTDRTREIAESLGVPVHIHQQLLPEYGTRPGKGEALWKSLFVTRGDLVVWIDSDIVNFHPRFVYGILGPLLTSPRIQFVKGFYRRPLRVGDKVQAGGGGRVTELTARPLLNLFYPELSGVVQPLSGEYGGRRSLLETLPFFSGYGVETGLLIDVFERHGLAAIAQVDLLERIHHNQPLEALGKMSFAIIQAVIRKLEGRYGTPMLDEVNKTMKLIRHTNAGYFLDVEEIAERERPPMIDVPEYRARKARRGLI